MDTTVQPGSRKGRPNYPTDFKLRLAQQACAPGVSVSRLAREHGINANMLFKWRRKYRAGLLGSVSASPLLLPVMIADAPASPASHASPSGRIEIVIADAIVRIDGAVDPATVRAVLQGLQP
ncbi:MAG TPA: transposase [Burkholderiaceae bacterium]|nr:transposase [Burkholderiaceae bacterium]